MFHIERNKQIILYGAGIGEETTRKKKPFIFYIPLKSHSGIPFLLSPNLILLLILSFFIPEYIVTPVLFQLSSRLCLYLSIDPLALSYLSPVCQDNITYFSDWQRFKSLKTFKRKREKNKENKGIEKGKEEKKEGIKEKKKE